MLWLYHSTFRSNLHSIKQFGLGAKQPKNWDFSENGVVCLASDPEVAFSFCESADEVPDYKYNSGIVVLAIPANSLIKTKVNEDHNISDRTPGVHYYTYSSVINPNLIHIVTRDKGIVGKMLEIKRIPSYE